MAAARSRQRPALTLGTAQRDELFAVGHRAGLDHIGSCSARSWTSARSHLEERRGEGLSATMAFTYRNPARSSDPTRILRSAATLVVAARSYAQTVLEPEPSDMALARKDDRDPPVRARVARYATADHYGRLEAGLGAVADALRGHGARAVVVADSNSLIDREAAWRAGLGWYGKNSLLLIPGSGSWFVLGSVVTDAVFDHVPSPVADGCGGCSRCLEQCPTGAIVAPGMVDARRCLAWMLQAPGDFPLEHRRALGDRIYGCDDCQEACPPNRTVELRSKRTERWPVESEPGTWVEALELLDLDDEALLQRCARWYIAQRDPAIVRRNLLVVLGNTGRPDDPAVRAALRSHLGHDNPVLASHARWAWDELDARAVVTPGPALSQRAGNDEDEPAMKPPTPVP